MSNLIYIYRIEADTDSYGGYTIEENYQDLEEALEGFSTFLDRHRQELYELECHLNEFDDWVYLSFDFNVLLELGNDSYECVYERSKVYEEDVVDMEMTDDIVDDVRQWINGAIDDFEAQDYRDL